MALKIALCWKTAAMNSSSPRRGSPKKFSWEKTYQEMAAEGSAGDGWDCTVADGLDGIPWDRPLPAKATTRKPAQASKAK